MTWWAAVVLAACAIASAAGCGDDPITVRSHVDDSADYNRSELLTAVAAFVAAGRTPAAYAAMAAEVERLRPGMDETVAELAELQLVVLAAAVVEAEREFPPAVQVERLATTVWPVALGPPITAFDPTGWRNPREQQIRLREGESAAAYVRRLCEGPFAVECKHVVPEWQGPVLGTEAISRMTARVRAAIANCEECDDRGWLDAVARWQALDHRATAERRRFEDLGSPRQWPLAGPGSVPWPDQVAAVIEVQLDGDWVVDGLAIDPERRAEALDELRRRGDVLGIHVRPATLLATLDVLVEAAAAARFPEILIQARMPSYPWDLRAYRVRPPGKRPRAVRGETVQVQLRRLDSRAQRAPDAERSEPDRPWRR